jgi:hypothetical protein
MTEKIRVLGFAAALLLLLSATALAAGTGSLTVVEVWDAVALYAVAGPDGTLTEQFAHAPVTDLTDEKMAVQNAVLLEQYVRENRLSGQIRIPDGNGTVRYEQLPEGLYLIVSNAEPTAFNAFLAAIPTVINGELIYDVEAAPKVEDPPGEPTEPSDPTAPTDPGKPTDPTEPPPPDGPGIPDTGVVQWPKYLMLTVGLLMILLGTGEMVKGREAQ